MLGKPHRVPTEGPTGPEATVSVAGSVTSGLGLTAPASSATSWSVPRSTTGPTRGDDHAALWLTLDLTEWPVRRAARLSGIVRGPIIES